MSNCPRLDALLGRKPGMWREWHDVDFCELESLARELERELGRRTEVAPSIWISMKERQPADFERVLCVNSNNYMTTANRFHDTHQGSWNGSDYTAEEHQDLVIGDITHWMPLPPFPAEEQGNLQPGNSDGPQSPRMEDK